LPSEATFATFDLLSAESECSDALNCSCISSLSFSLLRLLGILRAAGGSAARRAARARGRGARPVLGARSAPSKF
jgi:hypothetical protein